MSAVLGGEEAEVLACLEDLELIAANRNAAGQIVAAGRTDALEKLAENPPAKARVRRLATAGAFHTHFMASALDGYAAAAAAVATGEPTAVVVSNADGQPVISASDAMTKLVAQLTRFQGRSKLIVVPFGLAQRQLAGKAGDHEEGDARDRQREDRGLPLGMCRAPIGVTLKKARRRRGHPRQMPQISNRS